MTLLFVIGSTLSTDSDPYLALRPDGDKNPLPASIPIGIVAEGLPAPNKSQLLFHINRLINVYRLCIPLSVTPDILAVAYGKSHLGFSHCYEIITRFWFIHGLTKLLSTFICHYPQCLAFQIRRHTPYGSLQLIESPPVLFFSLTLDFVLAFPLSKVEYNTMISVTCKFSKRVTLIEGIDTWLAEQWAHVFLNRLDLIDWGLPGELITDRNPKFLSKFWTTLFTKLGVKLLYSMAYYPQTNGSNERTNQTVEIALRFFIYAMDDPSRWPKVLPRIQSLLNNAFSSTIRKTPSKIAYRFSPRRPLDLCSAVTSPDTYVARTEASDMIFFVLANQKEHYNRSHQPLFMKVGDWAMLKIYKSYSISSSVGITKKLTQQYVGPF